MWAERVGGRNGWVASVGALMPECRRAASKGQQGSGGEAGQAAELRLHCQPHSPAQRSIQHTHRQHSGACLYGIVSARCQGGQYSTAQHSTAQHRQHRQHSGACLDGSVGARRQGGQEALWIQWAQHLPQLAVKATLKGQQGSQEQAGHAPAF